MGSIPVLNDQQMAALRRVTGTNQSFKLVPAAKAKSRRLPSYDGEEPVNAVEYNGYFTLKTRVENDAVKIVVCDGATYNEENGTSQASVCKVNNAYFDVPYISLDPVSPGKYIILVYDPSYGTRGRVTVEQVTRMSEEARPSYILGTYTVAGDGKINIIQRHGTVATQFMANGVAAIEYYLDPCQEEQ